MGRGIPLSMLSAEQRAAVRAEQGKSAPNVVGATVRGHGKRQGQPSAVEHRYQAHLERLLAAREISYYMPQPEPIELANRCCYTTDFEVGYPDGHLEWHEIKGRKGNRPWFHDDGARVKTKVAARLLAQRKPPVALVVVWPRKGGGWESERVKP